MSDAPPPTSITLPRGPVRALVHAWLILDFFGESRRSGQPSSTLTTTIFGQAFLAFLVAAVLFPDTPLVAFAGANMSVSTLFVGIGHLGDDRAATRRRADAALVAPSPLPRARLLGARALYASFYVCLLTVGMALPPAILCAFLPGQGIGIVPAYLAAACACAGLFTAGLAIGLRVAERLLGPGRAQLLSGTVKALLLLGGLVGFASGARHLDEGLGAMPFPRLAVELWPPYWAGRALAGDAMFVGALLGGLALLGLLGWWLVRDTEASAATRVRSSGLGQGLLRRLARGQAPLLGAATFTAAMLYRSTGFRARVLPLFGLPVGMWWLAFTSGDAAAAQRLAAVAAQLPAVYLPFLIAFLGTGDEPRARWLFETAPTMPATRLRHAVLLALTTHVLLPVHAVLLAATIATAPLDALLRSAFALGIAVLAARLCLRRFDALPFSEAEGSQPLEFGGLVAAALGLTLLGLGFSVLPTAVAGPVAVAALAAAWLQLRGRTEP